MWSRGTSDGQCPYKGTIEKKKCLLIIPQWISPIFSSMVEMNLHQGMHVCCPAQTYFSQGRHRKIVRIFRLTAARTSCFTMFLIRHTTRNRLNVQHAGASHGSAIFNRAFSTVSGNTTKQHVFASSLSQEGLERGNLGYFSTLYSQLVTTLKVRVCSR